MKNVFELFGSIAINNKDAHAALNETSDRAERTGKRIQAAFKSIGEVSLKIGKAVVGGASAIGTAWAATVESTRDYRTAMAKLDAAFVANGHSSQAATNTYKALQAVLGETDQAVEAANHLAKLCTNEQDLKKWTDICTGVYATFGDSLPIEGLTEAANETAKTGVVTGSLADALNWAGISEEDFNKKLQACVSESQRQKLIMETLFWTYKAAGDQYKETGEDVMRANMAQENLNNAMAKLGEIGEPIMSGLKNWVADMVNAAAPHLQTLIDKLVNFDTTMQTEVWPWLQKQANVAFGVDLPDWETFKGDAATWWENTKTSMQNICTWTLKIFDEPGEAAEDVAAALGSWWTNTALPGIASVCRWTLALFGHPVENPDQISSYVKSWWLGVGDTVSRACEWHLKLFGMPKEDAAAISEKIRTWWASVAGPVESAVDWTLKFTGFAPWTSEDTAALRAWWDGVYEGIVNICSWSLPKPKLEPLTEEDAQAIVESITAWWDNVKRRIKLTFGITPRIEGLANAYQSDLGNSLGGGITGQIGQGFIGNSDSFIDYRSIFNGLFSHAGGLETVPHDGYPARLHKGEAVLTAAEADVWRGGGTDRIEALLEQLVQLTTAGQSLTLDSGILAGQIAPAIDAQLGAISRRKGRRN